MELVSLEVKNLFVFDKPCTVEFERNPTFLIGPNGIGKSSLLETIFIAFYRKPIRTHAINSILNDPQQDGYVKVEFRLSNTLYRIERFIGKTSKIDKLYKQNQLVTQGAQNVTHMIEKLLCPSDYWISFVPQRHLLEVLKPGVFKDLYQKLFRIDRIYLFLKASDKLAGQTSTEIGVKRKELEHIQNELKQFEDLDEKLLYSLEQKREWLLNEINQLTQEQNKIEEIVFLEKRIEQLSSEISQLKQHYHIQQQTKHLLYLVKENIDKSKLAVVNYFKNRIDDIRKGFLLSKQKRQVFQEKLQMIKSEWSEFQNIKHNMKFVLKLEQLKAKYGNYDLKLLTSKQSRFVYSKTQLKDIARRVILFFDKEFDLGLVTKTTHSHDIAVSVDDLNTLKHYLTTKEFLLDAPELDEEELKLLQNFENWSEVDVFIKQIKSEFDRKKKNLRYIHTRIEAVYSSIQRVLESILDVTDTFKSFDEVLKYKRILEDIQFLSTYCKSFEEWKQIMEKHVDNTLIQQKQNELEELNRKLQELYQKRKQIQQKLDSLHEELRKLDAQIQQLKSLFMYRQQLLDRQRSYLDDIKSLELRVKKLENVKQILEDVRDLIHNRFREILPVFVRTIVERFGFDFHIVITDDFEINIKKQNQVFTPQMLSGAQQSILALAIRYAIVKLLNLDLPFILDEVSEGFDIHRLDLLKGIINQIAHTHQVIVVSHDDRIISDSVGELIMLEQLL